MSKYQFPPIPGFVYAYVNPAYPGLVKIGSTAGLSQRFASASTWDPHKAGRFVAWTDVYAEAKKAETAVHNHFSGSRVSPRGEWFRVSESAVVAHLNSLRRVPLPVGAAIEDDPFTSCAVLDGDADDEST